MQRTMLKSKIHRASVTQADLHYVGSLTVDAELMQAADLLAGEQVQVVDINNGARLETYVIEGPRGSGIIGINGAAARLVHPGDLVIIISYASLDDAEARAFVPRVVHVDAGNRVTGTGADAAEPVPGTATVRGDTVCSALYRRRAANLPSSRAGQGPFPRCSARRAVPGTLQLFSEPQVLRAITSDISSSYTPNPLAYTQAFTANNPNYAAAIAVVLAIGTFILSFGFLKLVQRRGGAA